MKISNVHSGIHISRWAQAETQDTYIPHHPSTWQTGYIPEPHTNEMLVTIDYHQILLVSMPAPKAIHGELQKRSPRRHGTVGMKTKATKIPQPIKADLHPRKQALERQGRPRLICVDSGRGHAAHQEKQMVSIMGQELRRWQPSSWANVVKTEKPHKWCAAWIWRCLPPVMKMILFSWGY